MEGNNDHDGSMLEPGQPKPGPNTEPKDEPKTEPEAESKNE